jgi:hypothetical protein
MCSRLLAVALGAALSLAVSPAHAEQAPPSALPTLDAPRPGMLTVQVDLSDAPKKMFRVHETIPVAQPGALTLYYPKWIPGEHSPSGPIDNVAGLVITANGKKVPWRRDLRDMYTLHLDVPADADEVDIRFLFLSPGEGGQFGASASSTPNLVDVEFN